MPFKLPYICVYKLTHDYYMMVITLDTYFIFLVPVFSVLLFFQMQVYLPIVVANMWVMHAVIPLKRVTNNYDCMWCYSQ